ncbi:MAG: hypothetical protein AAF518_21395 [Spirochaetota bacterium]
MPLVLVSFSTCASTDSLGTGRISTFAKNTYSSDKQKHQQSQKEIQALLQAVIDAILQENWKTLPQMVHPERGLFVDLKAHWSYEKVSKEVSRKDSYLAVYFFDKKRLQAQKRTKDVETVKEILLRSGGLDMDFFFIDSKNCEVKLSFHKNQSYSTDLNSPYFIKMDGKWYIYRLL